MKNIFTLIFSPTIVSLLFGIWGVWDEYKVSNGFDFKYLLPSFSFGLLLGLGVLAFESYHSQREERMQKHNTNIKISSLPVTVIVLYQVISLLFTENDGIVSIFTISIYILTLSLAMIIYWALHGKFIKWEDIEFPFQTYFWDKKRTIK